MSLRIHLRRPLLVPAIISLVICHRVIVMMRQQIQQAVVFVVGVVKGWFPPGPYWQLAVGGLDHKRMITSVMVQGFFSLDFNFMLFLLLVIADWWIFGSLAWTSFFNRVFQDFQLIKGLNLSWPNLRVRWSYWGCLWRWSWWVGTLRVGSLRGFVWFIWWCTWFLCRGFVFSWFLGLLFEAFFADLWHFQLGS